MGFSFPTICICAEITFLMGDNLYSLERGRDEYQRVTNRGIWQEKCEFVEIEKQKMAIANLYPSLISRHRVSFDDFTVLERDVSRHKSIRYGERYLTKCLHYGSKLYSP